MFQYLTQFICNTSNRYSDGLHQPCCQLAQSTLTTLRAKAGPLIDFSQPMGSILQRTAYVATSTFKIIIKGSLGTVSYMNKSPFLSGLSLTATGLFCIGKGVEALEEPKNLLKSVTLLGVGALTLYTGASILNDVGLAYTALEMAQSKC